MAQHQAIRVRVWRGDTVESQHLVVAVVVDTHGHVHERWGDEVVTFWRSSAKPFQAAAWVSDGTVDHFGWGSHELAMMSASHSGTPEHVQLVQRMLADLGLSEADLQCERDGSARHECSGNHTGLLAASVFHGWSTHDYREPDHPTQQRSLAAVAAAADVRPEDVGIGADGCGILTFATAISATARAFAQIDQSAPRVAAAMRAHPLLVEGEGLLDTVIMQAFPGTTSKCGAEGLGCTALPDGRAIVMKVLDGADRATDPALIGLLTVLGGFQEPPGPASSLLTPPIHNRHGEVVGRLEAQLD